MIQRFDAFVSGITSCYKYIQRIKSMEMTEFGLKGTHVMCLYYLRQNPAGLTASQLCGLCAEDKAAISRTVSELKSRGYITTLSQKAYRAMLTLTAAGQEVARKFDQLIESWVTAGGDGLTEEERSDFYKSLSSIAENLRIRIESELKHTT
ncbi:MAG: winged helix-turn-helix transcriptional regulator [Oscillospiraceae bacterium]|nr:winged helix-turn-helix transcriptional regulator [Oscillospiraceae bacterium]